MVELESVKADEKIKELRKGLNQFLRIEGYRWRIEILSTVADILNMFGIR